MSALNPTLAGAVLKAERGIAFLRLPGATSDHLRQAMDCFKSAGKLAASHFTVLVELEDQVPEPGPALFDETGAPAPGVAGGQAVGLGLRLEEHPVLSMSEADYLDFSRKKQESLDEEMLFALRLHTRARGLGYDAIRDLIMDDLGGFGDGTFDWVVEQITTSGSFEWPHRCEDCQCADTPAANGEVLCWSCKSKRQRDAIAKAKKDEKKAAKAKPTQKNKNPLEAHDLEEHS